MGRGVWIVRKNVIRDALNLPPDADIVYTYDDGVMPGCVRIIVEHPDIPLPEPGHQLLSIVRKIVPVFEHGPHSTKVIDWGLSNE